MLWSSMAAIPYFMANSQYKLKVRAEGYADDRAIWDAMAKDPSLAVVTADTVQTGEAFAGSFPFMIEGLKPDDKSMQPVSVMLRSPRRRQERCVQGHRCARRQQYGRVRSPVHLDGRPGAGRGPCRRAEPVLLQAGAGSRRGRGRAGV